jgi:hypothetical protein
MALVFLLVAVLATFSLFSLSQTAALSFSQHGRDSIAGELLHWIGDSSANRTLSHRGASVAISDPHEFDGLDDFCDDGETIS